MKTITVEELEKIEWNQSMVVDIRPNDQYQRGTFPWAVNIPMAELEERRKELDEAKTIYMLCHTGDRSQESVLGKSIYERWSDTAKMILSITFWMIMN